MEMIKPTGYIDGEIGPLDEISVPVLDRGFLYGDSIYEVFRTYSGIPFMFEEHYVRLMNSARLSMMNIHQRKSEIVAAIKETVAVALDESVEDIYVRYQITRGAGRVDLYPDPNLRSRLVIMVKDIPQWNPEYYSRGITVSVPAMRRNSVDALNPNIKGGNYMNNILGLSAAREMGTDECVMLDSNGWVTECSNSNIWFVLNGEVVTPASGNLLGLTRKVLVGLFDRTGHKNIERDIHGEQLSNVTECFVTSATREVMPVASLRLQNGATIEFPPGGGQLTRTAMNLYSEMLAEFVANNRDKAWF